jgi:methylmalonyl-CoA mutase N-terminal domain/subunit
MKRDTSSGIPVKPSYVDPWQNEGERPGRFPFTRGIYENMYRDRLWTMRQYSGYATSDESNERLRFMLSEGQTGLSIAFDLPTQLGLDSDNKRAYGEIGKVGVGISMLEDMRRLFNGIDLRQVSTSMTINATAPILFCMYIATAEDTGAKKTEVRGTVQNDILKEYIARNTYIYPPAPSLKLAIDLIEFSVKNYPKWHPISISGYHMREAGSTAVQELAFTFADAITYVEAALERGLKIDDFAPSLSFFLTCNNDFFEEIAKFRAARRIWAHLAKERFGAKKEGSMKFRFHTQTAGETLTAQEPENNIVRVAVQALAAVLGGTQSLHTNSMDEALSLPREQSAMLALRTQQVIAYESGTTKTADPLGGSYFLEHLTEKLERTALREVRRIEKMGGMLRAIESGYVQREIHRAAYEKQVRIEKHDIIVVGVNKYQSRPSSGYKLPQVPKRIQTARIAQLVRFKKARDRSAVDNALGKIRSEAPRSKNLIPSIMAAVKANCTVGEISDVLRDVYGEYKPETRF